MTPGAFRHGPPVVIDACVLIGLAATGNLEEILRLTLPEALVAEQVRQEALYVHTPGVEGSERRLIDLDPVCQAGTIQLAPFASDAEAATAIELAMRIEFGEAASAAIAIHRGCRLATDERKVIQLLEHRIEIIGTLDLVRDRDAQAGVDAARLRAALRGVRQQRYRPGTALRQYGWWMEILGDEG